MDPKDIADINNAVRRGELITLQILAQKAGINLDNPNHENVTPFYLAVQGNHYDMVKWFLENQHQQYAPSMESKHTAHRFLKTQTTVHNLPMLLQDFFQQECLQFSVLQWIFRK